MSWRKLPVQYNYVVVSTMITDHAWVLTWDVMIVYMQLTILLSAIVLLSNMNSDITTASVNCAILSLCSAVQPSNSLISASCSSSDPIHHLGLYHAYVSIKYRGYCILFWYACEQVHHTF